MAKITFPRIPFGECKDHFGPGVTEDSGMYPQAPADFV